MAWWSMSAFQHIWLCYLQISLDIVSRYLQVMLCSAAMDEGKRKVRIISSLSYYLIIIFLISSHVLLFIFLTH